MVYLDHDVVSDGQTETVVTRLRALVEGLEEVLHRRLGNPRAIVRHLELDPFGMRSQGDGDYPAPPTTPPAPALRSR